jgi:hypothetical protein
MLPVRSRQMIEEFAASNLAEGLVDVDKTGRTEENIYSALHAFLRRNPQYNITVRLHKGSVVLVKNAEQGSVISVH